MARQADRRATTSAAILASARGLFGAQGFAAATMDDIAQGAGVAKGAVYHHFPAKEAVFAAVFDEVAGEVEAQVNAAAQGQTDVLASMVAGVRAYFTLCSEGPTGRIMLKDGPAVLGWVRWREIDAAHFSGAMEAALSTAMAHGLIAQQPVAPLARLLLGAVTEAAMACGAAQDPQAASRQYSQALESLLDGLRSR